ncbi:MAG TPA: DUF58 domain-containing protein [Thermoanaerobaculia bacterium]|nr:DUF58 domain-containing protein [Thermoanaerobaculia bacterium]
MAQVYPAATAAPAAAPRPSRRCAATSCRNCGDWRAWAPSESIPEGIRITMVGLWYVLLSVLVAVAATNTGNNALYGVLALMFAVLILSGVLSRQNVRGLAITFDPPAEIFANRPFALGFALRSCGYLLPRWLLLLKPAVEARPVLLPFVPRHGRSQGRLEMLIPRRGPYRFQYAHVASLFPFGFFRKGVRYHLDLEVLVFPEIFPAAAGTPEEPENQGADATRHAGWGHALFALRGFRRGDDPRGIHWKQTARTGEIVFMEREAEQTRRLSIVFDNAVGQLADEAARRRFERLISEAATTALDHLARGYEVELVTRGQTLGFAAGVRQRLAILELLAMLAPAPRRHDPLTGRDPRASQLRIHLDAGSPEQPAAPREQQHVQVIAAAGVREERGRPR